MRRLEATLRAGASRAGRIPVAGDAPRSGVHVCRRPSWKALLFAQRTHEAFDAQACANRSNVEALQAQALLVGLYQRGAVGVLLACGWVRWASGARWPGSGRKHSAGPAAWLAACARRTRHGGKTVRQNAAVRARSPHLAPRCTRPGFSAWEGGGGGAAPEAVGQAGSSARAPRAPAAAAGRPRPHAGGAQRGARRPAATPSPARAGDGPLRRGHRIASRDRRTLVSGQAQQIFFFGLAASRPAAGAAAAGAAGSAAFFPKGHRPIAWKCFAAAMRVLLPEGSRHDWLGRQTSRAVTGLFFQALNFLSRPAQPTLDRSGDEGVTFGAAQPPNGQAPKAYAFRVIGTNIQRPPRAPRVA